MPHFPENNNVFEQDTGLPPVLNPIFCNCRSGCLCNRESEGDGEGANGDGDGASTTAVGSESNGPDVDQDDISSTSSNEDCEGVEDPEGGAHEVCRLSIAEVMERIVARHESQMVDFGHIEQVVEVEADGGVAPAVRRPYSPSSSMVNHGGSSAPASRVSSVCGSPGPHLEYWYEVEVTVVQLPRVAPRQNYFLETKLPLRLTPQRRDCRGLVSQHLILHDG